MVTIVRGTTPTFQYTFKSVNVSDIEVAYLTFKYCSQTVLEKDITTATIGGKTISWTLDQEETLSLPACCEECVYVRLNWKTLDDTRGVSKEIEVRIERNSKEVVI